MVSSPLVVSKLQCVVCSNQFGFQEPGSSDEIKNFASGKGFKGLLMEKIEVNGPKASPVYAFLKVCGIAEEPLCGLWKQTVINCPDDEQWNGWYVLMQEVSESQVYVLELHR